MYIPVQCDQIGVSSVKDSNSFNTVTLSLRTFLKKVPPSLCRIIKELCVYFYFLKNVNPVRLYGPLLLGTQEYLIQVEKGFLIT